MANREDVLRDQTYKDDVDEVEKRVFYTLTGKDSLQAHRVAKTLALVVELLRRRNLITDEEVDELLLDVVS